MLAFGILGDQARAETDSAHAVAVVHTDYVAQVSILTHLAEIMRRQGTGKIVVFSSVAGVRVRRANYVYGSAKAGLDGFASGLGDALHGSGVQLMLVRPGFVIGKMTEGMSPAPPMSSTPSQVADAVVRGLKSGGRRVCGFREFCSRCSSSCGFCLRRSGAGCRDDRTPGGDRRHRATAGTGCPRAQREQSSVRRS